MVIGPQKGQHRLALVGRMPLSAGPERDVLQRLVPRLICPRLHLDECAGRLDRFMSAGRRQVAWGVAAHLWRRRHGHDRGRQGRIVAGSAGDRAGRMDDRHGSERGERERQVEIARSQGQENDGSDSRGGRS